MKKRAKKHRDLAVALRYREKSDSAPRVVAKGEGLIAQKIRELAQEHHLPIHRDDGLVELLSQVALDQEIPPELYASVAEVLAWIYRANDEARKGIFAK
ncbi:MAG: EscU/YscU/HrcU family type III secretion system export apparatus switch protein [Chitinispirillaceae bacterium]|nr:EscU/YscU/HrcU family type III secretion system export apparatus switch protein [Chitinispirillaceae bacterium]